MLGIRSESQWLRQSRTSRRNMDRTMNPAPLPKLCVLAPLLPALLGFVLSTGCGETDAPMVVRPTTADAIPAGDATVPQPPSAPRTDPRDMGNAGSSCDEDSDCDGFCRKGVCQQLTGQQCVGGTCDSQWEFLDEQRSAQCLEHETDSYCIQPCVLYPEGGYQCIGRSQHSSNRFVCVADHRCMERCGSDSDCPLAIQWCDTDAPVPYCRHTSRPGGTPCDADSQCQLGTQCVEGMCAVAAAGDSCAEGGSCDGGSPQTGVIATKLAGGSQACALLTDRRILCWGWDGTTYTEDPAGGFIDVAAGTGFVCALDNGGALTCWGDEAPSSQDDAQDIEGSTFMRVAAGIDRACGLRTDGSVACLGDGLSGDEWDAFAAITDFVDLTVGRNTVCGLRSDGSLYCVGFAFSGDTPANINASPWTYLDVDATAGRHICAVSSHESVVCWGVSTESYDEVTGPNDWTLRAVEVSGGMQHTCARSKSTVTCWGRPDLTSVPAHVVGGNVQQLEAANVFTCALGTLGKVACWGSNVESTLPAVPSELVWAP